MEKIAEIKKKAACIRGTRSEERGKALGSLSQSLESVAQVWLSEVMLQQTTAAAVIPYFNKFVQRFPTVEDLAKSNVDDVLNLWAGLGYYSRARNLHKAANQVVALGGSFPSTVEELRGLSGVGDYTAAAIAAIAFGQRVLPIDGNIERIGARLFRIDDHPKGSSRLKEAIRSKLEDHVSYDRPGDFAQGLMDLGSKVCTPRKPNCKECPLSSICQSANLSQTDVEELPRKPPPKSKPYRSGVAVVVTASQSISRRSGRSVLELAKTKSVLARRRPNSTSLLGGMWELPWGYWPLTASEIKSFCSNVKRNTRGVKSVLVLDDDVKHVFSGFDLQLRVVQIELTYGENENPLDNITKVFQGLQSKKETLEVCEQPSWDIAGAELEWLQPDSRDLEGWSSLGKKLYKKSA